MLIQKIKELQDAIKKEFPEGGVSISVVGLEQGETDLTQPENKPTKYVETLGDKPPILPIDPDSIDIGKIKELLNGYARENGTEAAFSLVEKLTGGSKNPADIPKDKWAYVAQAVMVEGSK